MDGENSGGDDRGVGGEKAAQAPVGQQNRAQVQQQIERVVHQRLLAGDLIIQPERKVCQRVRTAHCLAERLGESGIIVKVKARNQRTAESRDGGSQQKKTRTHVQLRAYVKRPKNAAERKERLDQILAALAKMYPDAVCALHHGNPWELLVATILSAQCTDKRVNEVTPGLFAKYPTPQDFAAVRPEVLAQDIRSTGFFNNKAKSIVGAALRITSEFGGKVPRTMEELLTVPGAARKTANVVLGTAYNIASGIVVDTHVQRISGRLDLTKQTDPVKIEQDLVKIIPNDLWIVFSHRIILHGRALCVARNPKCTECAINPLCYAKDKTADVPEPASQNLNVPMV
jgi:endonuclease III